MKKFKPHLACDGNFETMKFPKIAMRKIDGVRMLNVDGKALGRSLKPHANIHITNKFSEEMFSGMDGELVLTGQETSESLCRDTTSAVNRINGEPDVSWCVFDYVHPDIAHLPYKERLEKLTSRIGVDQTQTIKIVPWSIVNSKEEAEEFYLRSLELGYEGAIFRDPNAKHKSGRCTEKEGAYLRMKPSSDKEALVLSLDEAMENLNEAKINELGLSERSSHKENKVGKGMLGALICRDVTTGMEITVGAGCMTHEERIHYWNNPQEIIGKYIKYKSMDVGVKEKPRFPRYMSIRAESDMS